MTIATYARINTSNQSCEMKPHELSPAAQKPAPGPFRRLTGLLGDSPYRSKPLASACPQRRCSVVAPLDHGDSRIQSNFDFFRVAFLF
jgi:hypothetical protein